MNEDLISIHGLVDSDFDDPVRSFEGTFAGFETSPAQGYDGTRVELQFKDLDNVIAVTPYDLPPRRESRSQR